MTIRNIWIRQLKKMLAGPVQRTYRRPPTQLRLETLEDRTVPAAFTAGDLAIFQAAASVSNTTASIIELSPSNANQTPTNTIAIDGTTTPNELRFSGSATSTGYLSHTNDGTLLTFLGANSTNTSSNVNSLNPRGVGTLDASGTFTLQTTYTGVSGDQTRSATSLNDSTWFIADQGGLYTNGATAASPTGNLRAIKSFGGTVYANQASSVATNIQVDTVSAASGGTITGLPGLTNNANIQDFYLIKSGSNGSTYDVLYVVSATSNTAGTIAKFSLVSGTWTANSTYTTTFGGFGLAAAPSSGGAVLYVSSGQGALTANKVFKLTDTAGYNSAINITTANNVTLYTAPTGTIVKGVDFVPIAAEAITTNPTNKNINVGQGTTFTAATSNPTDTVQWKVSTDGGSTFSALSDGGAYSGTATTTLTISNAPSTLNGNKYEAVFTTATGTLTTTAAKLTVDAITTNPTNKDINVGQDTIFTAASANPTITDTVKWQVSTDGGATFSALSDGGAYSGTATATLTISSATASLNGNRYEAIFTNAAGTLTTSAAKLTVDAITGNPANKDINVGQDTTFTAASANPTSTDTVQWQVSADGGATFSALSDGGVYSGTATTTLTISTATASLSGNRYEAIFTNAAGTLTTTAATLTVDAITGNPANKDINVGQDTTFTAASANPTSTDTVQWQVSTDGGTSFSALSDGGVYSGTATTTLTISTATASLSGNRYEAIFSNAAGTLTTTAAKLTVDALTTNPANKDINVGQDTTFTAATSNPTGTDTVQWQVSADGGATFSALSDGGVYSGTATTTLTVSSATASLTGNEYEAIFTNAAGTLTTTAATLTVDAITGNPANKDINVGQDTTFTAASANPTSTDTVQWQVSTDGGTSFSALSDGGVYSGTATTTLTISTATASLSGNRYEAIFSNAAGTLTTTAAKLTVDAITGNPANKDINVGQDTTFTAATSNPTGTDTVQWQVSADGGATFSALSDGGVYSGTATTTLTVSSATASLTGNEYEAIFTNAAGTLTTTAAKLTVDYVTTNPANANVNSGQDATFTAATANPTGTDTVQWQVSTDGGATFSALSDGGAYSGTATTTLTIISATASLNGYKYEAVVSNAAGTLTTSAAALTIDGADAITTNPTNKDINVGQDATFTAATSNPTGTDTVQWQVSTDGGVTFNALGDGGVYSGTATTTLTISNATALLNGNVYEAIFTNATGTLTTTAATLTVDAITGNPANKDINVGQGTTFTAASGDPTGTDTVQWQVSTDGGTTFSALSDGGAYSGTATTTLTISNATASLSGNEYEAVFSNAAGTLTTTAAMLTVDSVTANPANKDINVGQGTTFTASTSDPTSSDTVQWQVSTDNGATFSALSDAGAYSGTATTTLTISNASSTLSGNKYEAIFTNAVGTLTTSAATLTVDAVTANPANKDINVGQGTTFTAATSNPTSTDTVQWQVSTDGGATFSALSDGGAYSGTATTTLTISNASSTLSGNEYEAVFSNAAGTLTTSAAKLTVDAITANPNNKDINVGQGTTFTAATSNPTGSDTVQWQVSTDGGTTFSALSDGGVYSGTATTTLTISNATASLNSYKYDAVFSSAAGTLTTSAATLTVDAITGNQANRDINVGQGTTFTAATSNPTGTDTVQWQVSTDNGATFNALSDGGAYSGTATTTLTISNATASLTGNEYEAIFSNAAGTLTTTAATLTVDAITTNPANKDINVSQGTTFTASTSNPTGTDTVQWQVSTDNGATFSALSDGGAYSGTTTTTLTISNAPSTLSGNKYEAIFTNAAGTLTTSTATLTVDAITANPANKDINVGQGTTFTAASANPTGTDTVQWQVSTDGGTTFSALSDGGAYSGTATTTLTISNAPSTLSGNKYEAIFSNTAGTLTTSAATLTVDYVTTNPSNANINGGDNATFTSASANPTSTDTVQWQVSTDGGTTFSALSDGGVYSGTATTTLTITSAPTSLNGYQYKAVFSNASGTLTTSAATLGVSGGIPKQFVNENSVNNTVDFTVSLPPAAPGTLTVTATSDNQSVIPNASLSVTGSGAIRTLHITPAHNVIGEANITLKVEDTMSNSYNQVVPVLVTTTQSVGFADDFNQRDIPFLGVGWNEKVGDFATTTLHGVGNAAPINLGTVYGLATTDQSIFGGFQLSAIGDIGGLVARYSGPGDQNMYLGQLMRTSAGYTASISKNVAGTWTPLTSQSVAATGNDQLEFDVIGSTLTLTVDGNAAGSVTDTSITGAGSAGVRTSPNVTISNFSVPFVDKFPVNGALGSAWTTQLGNFIVNSGLVNGASKLNVATANGFTYNDSAVQATVNLTAAGQFAGLISHYGGPGEANMYWAGLNNLAGTTQAQIWRNTGGNWVQLASQNVAGAGGTLLFETTGSSLRLFLNNNLVAWTNDGGLTGIGAVGMRMSSGATLANFSATAMNLNNPGLPFSDDFHTAVNKQLSQNWLNQLGNFQLAGGVATAQPGLDVATLNGVNADNVFAQADVNVAGGQFAGLVAHYSGPGDTNMYWAGLNGFGGPVQAQIWRNINDSWALLFSQSVGSGSGTLRLEAAGSSLKLFQNNNLVAYANDSLLTGGTVGMRAAGGATFDNFNADLLTPNSPTLNGLGTGFNDHFTTATNQQLSNSWLNQLGDFQVAGGVATAQPGLDIATLNGVNAANVFAQADVNVAGGQFAGLVAHYSGPGDSNMYWAGLNGFGSPVQAQIWRNVNGLWTLLFSQSVGSGSGTLRLEVVGSSLKLFQNNNLVAYANDSQLTGGTVGMRAAGGATFDNFNADLLTLNNPGLFFNDNFTAATNQQLSNSWLNQLGNFQVAGGLATARGSLDIATVNGVSTLNSTVQADVSVSAGQFAGLVSRYSVPGDANMYWAGLSAVGGPLQAQIWRNVGGIWMQLAAQNVASGNVTLMLVTSATSLQLSLNGSPTLSVTDTALNTAGTVGIRASMGATIDNFQSS